METALLLVQCITCLLGLGLAAVLQNEADYCMSLVGSALWMLMARLRKAAAVHFFLQDYFFVAPICLCLQKITMAQLSYY